MEGLMLTHDLTGGVFARVVGVAALQNIVSIAIQGDLGLITQFREAVQDDAQGRGTHIWLGSIAANIGINVDGRRGGGLRWLRRRRMPRVGSSKSPSGHEGSKREVLGEVHDG